ncbi:MAG TPA: hypothetical protein VER12_15620 [Polyangiaceae bacterium]|nr:hypothetical protein [Polyangiaceae bacterium]
MKILNRSSLKRAFSTVGAIGLFAMVAGAGCSSATDGTGTPASCSGLDANVSAQATVRAFGQAASALKDAALDVEAKWLATCNAINADLGEDSSKTSASQACAVLNARVKKSLDAGATVQLEVKAECHADVSVQGDCQAKCKLPNCDIKAQCEKGKLAVACEGSCSGSCDVKAPSATCTGTCSGKCTADVAVKCSGSCTGDCSDLKWSGVCEAGCSADFSGTCGGTCMGKCDGMNSSGACDGKCEGTCSAKASGSCSAKCTGQFTGSCQAECKGSCEATGGAQCSGKCEGTCTYEPGHADCNGTCHGECSAEVAPPTCEGTLNCEGAAECQASCEGSASAKANCDSSATLSVKGDDELYGALQAHIGDIKAAMALTGNLTKPIGELAKKTTATFSALGDIGAQGLACAGSSLNIMGEARASIQVSVSASASVQGTAETK